MNESWMNSISPYVRVAKVMESSLLAGEWLDQDHVYTYIDQGEAEFFLNGVKFLVREGDVLLMHPCLPHIIRSTSALPLVQYIFHFDLYDNEDKSSSDQADGLRPGIQDIMPSEMQLADIYPLSHLQLPDRIELKRRFMQLQKEMLDPTYGGVLINKSICLELLFLFFRNQNLSKGTEGKRTKGWPLIEGAIHHMHQCYQDPQLSNESISSHVGVTANHLSYVFKTQLGVTIHNYLKHVRIEQAKLRIIQGKQNLTEIAEDVGFSSIHLFSRTFKTNVGVMPSKFAAMRSALINKSQ
ncbi:helix-turn-helix transcriptional regulator [Paenibacillus sp. FSL H7-0918]|uniref:helix-turn-helix transcriptional regulator n=1 Tax=Paenibacillus sp. FSL H7-0918 TaxID=2921442 RepID=UPI0030F5EA82